MKIMQSTYLFFFNNTALITTEDYELFRIVPQVGEAIKKIIIQWWLQWDGGIQFIGLWAYQRGMFKNTAFMRKVRN